MGEFQQERGSPTGAEGAMEEGFNRGAETRVKLSRLGDPSRDLFRVALHSHSMTSPNGRGIERDVSRSVAQNGSSKRLMAIMAPFSVSCSSDKYLFLSLNREDFGHFRQNPEKVRQELRPPF